MKPFLAAAALLVLVVAACAAPRAQTPPVPPAALEPKSTLTQDQAMTLASLQLVDDHPLDTMHDV